SHHSAFAPAILTTLPHFSVSSMTSLVNSACDPGSTVAPRPANRDFSVGSARAALISLLSLPMISDDVFFGAKRPVHWLASNPGKKSPTVGASGRASERLAVVTAKARSFVALMYSIDAGMSVNVVWIWPPRRSVIACPALRYGT